MSPNSDWDSRSMDSRPSDFNDGAEAILMNAGFGIEAPRGEGDNQSRCSTPESHNDCQGYNAHGQGASVYSCGCYKYREMERYKYPVPSPPDLEQGLKSGNGDFGDINALSPKRKIRDENDSLHSFLHDITNVCVTSVPTIELPPSKRRKLGRHSESFEGGSTQSLAKIAQEVAVMGEALVRIKEVLDGQFS